MDNRLLSDASYCLRRSKKLRMSAQSKLDKLRPAKDEFEEMSKHPEGREKEMSELNKLIQDGLDEVKALADRADFYSGRARRLLDSYE